MSKTALVLFLLVCGVARAEQVVDIESKVYYLCKNHKQVRTVRVMVDQGICSTIYSKEGAEKVVGSGKNYDSCIHFMDNIKANLEKSNWTCRDISSTRVTASLK
jgi:hypothetical protein